MSKETLRKLREATGAGMLDCKEALTEANDDFSKAREILTQKGKIIGNIRGNKDANQGIVKAITTKDTPKDTDSHYGTIIVLNCETDFVAKNDDFKQLAEEISQYTVENDEVSLKKLQEVFEKKIADLMSSIKENIKLSHYESLEGEHIALYNHHKNNISVLVAFNKKYDEEVGKNIAMQIAGMNPIYVAVSDISKKVVEREKEFIDEKIKQNDSLKDKSEDILERVKKNMLTGALADMTLLEQEYNQAEKKGQTVKDYLRSIDKELSVLGFTSFVIG